jgi:fumarate reductase flavoprotein subunit
MDAEPHMIGPEINSDKKPSAPLPFLSKPMAFPKRKDAVPERKYSFETPPGEIPAGSINKTISSDIVVVGAGISGVCAALSAVESGAKVVLIEKHKTYQGFGGHNAAIGSRLQKKLGIDVDREDVIANMMRFASNKPDQRLLRMWAYHSGETMDWLMDMTDAAGLKVTIDQYPPPAESVIDNRYYQQYFTSHDFDFKQRQVVKCLLDNAVKKGLTVYFETRARQMVRKGDGPVTAIIAQDKQGEYISFHAAKAVVLCTGDYGYNTEMVAKYCPEAGDLATMLVTSTGDGHQMAMWVGATMESAPHAAIIHGPAGPLGSTPFLQVNIKGERFQNEDVPCEVYCLAVKKQPGQIAWQVFDSKYAEETPRMGIGHLRVGKITDDIRHAIETTALSANTIGELAEKMEVPVSALKATVDRYNELARKGQDLDFGKRADRLTTISKPPYFAGKGQIMFFAAVGGINANAKMQALDKDWNIIPGLYLGGNIVGNRYGNIYPSMMPGLSNGMALFFGRIAGLNAAKYGSSI